MWCCRLTAFPVVTLELKNPLSGQTAANAIHQYRQTATREPIFVFTKRSLVHFAVDTEEAHGHPAGWFIHHFLPFNRGVDGGAGNPPDREGATTRRRYLWEVLQRTACSTCSPASFIWMCKQGDRRTARRFAEKPDLPRYHQLQAVRRMVAAAAIEGWGINYLVEHSAGSGKNNDHCLAGTGCPACTTNATNGCSTVWWSSPTAVLIASCRTPSTSSTTARAWCRRSTRFAPVGRGAGSGRADHHHHAAEVPLRVGAAGRRNEERGEAGKSHLPMRKYAVIIDEAHSSQSGETATELKGVLAEPNLRKKAQEMAEDEVKIELERLFRSMAKRGQQPNMSFFAFTATPKHKTLAIFGRNGEPSTATPCARRLRKASSRMCSRTTSPTRLTKLIKKPRTIPTSSARRQ